MAAVRWLDTSNFNPRSPWGERPPGSGTPLSPHLFQSTLPVGGATFAQLDEVCYRWISIHAPRGGSDGRPPDSPGSHNISIHAPRGGSDDSGYPVWAQPTDFNPRSPWGERLLTGWLKSAPVSFQSTLPVGGATEDRIKSVISTGISIHAPRGGSDLPG